MNDPVGQASLPEPRFHEESAAVRFWVRTAAGDVIGASVPKQVLHFRFNAANATTGARSAIETYLANRDTIDAATRRRIANGSIEPVMLREHDLA